MATRSGIDTAVLNRLDDDHVFIGGAVDLDFDSGNVRIWNGIGDISIGGNDFTGAGNLLSIGDISDETDLKSTGVTLSLSGMDTTVLNLAITENYVNRPIIIYLVFLAGGSNEVVGTMTSFSGRLQTMTISDDPNNGVRIQVTAENRLVDLQRPSNLRYTNSSQQFVSSGDTCFRYVAQMEDLEIVWGKDGQGGSAGLTNNTASGGNKWF